MYSIIDEFGSVDVQVVEGGQGVDFRLNLSELPISLDAGLFDGEAGPCRIHHFEDEPEPTSGKLSLHNYKHAGFLEFNNVSLQHVYGIGQSDCM